MSTQVRVVMRFAVLVLVAMVAIVSLSCAGKNRLAYQKGMEHLYAQEYGDAIIKFDESLAIEPEGKMARYGKARALYGLKRFEEAMPLFQDFITRTEPEKSSFSDVRKDAAWHILKCKTELGIHIEQSEDDIPPEKMGG